MHSQPLKSAVALISAFALIITTVATPALAQQRKLTKPAVRPNTAILTNTWVRGVRQNEVEGKKTFTKITINAPEIMQFEWGTKAVASEEGFWRLVRLGPGQNQETLLASGVSQPGSGGAFSIDLRQSLPPQPPTSAIVYHVQVIPRKRSGSDASTAVSPGHAGSKVPAATIGSWSPPVVITYVAAPAGPGTAFVFPEVYRKARLVLDDFRVVEDQIGSGQEEYHIGGFMEEMLWSSSGGGRFNRPGRQIKIGPYYREMNPPMTTGFTPGPATPQKQFWDLTLNTDKNDWPRRFAVVISVIEEDGGSEIGDWTAGINGLQSFAKTSAALDMSKDQLLEYLQRHGLDGVNFFLDAANVIASLATQSAAVTGPLMLAGTFVVLGTVAVWAIWVDSADDYYGTTAGAMTLPSNRVEEVRKLPGSLKGSGKNEAYVLKPQTLQFKGPPGATEAAAFDGIVEFTYHWEFLDRDLE